MANPGHLEKLKQGVEAWNKWRKEHGDIAPDLSKADLAGAALWDANLRSVNLEQANLSTAKLAAARFWGAKLRSAVLNGADLSFADFSYADLSNASFQGAHIGCTYFRNAKVESCKFHGAHASYSVFINIDLCCVEGIEEVFHSRPSSIDTDTLKRSAEGLSIDPSRLSAIETFLRGAGIEKRIISYFCEMIKEPIETYSCFISYSHADNAFAKRLYASLQGQGIRCFKDDPDGRPGEPIIDMADRGIRTAERTLLCCSKASLNSTWVSRELNKHFAKEEMASKKEGKPQHFLIPLNLDGYIFEKDADGGFVCQIGWADEIRSRIAADFTTWDTDREKFEEQIRRVLSVLR